MREKKKPRVQQRSPENTTVAFSCSKKFLAQIDEAARQERRTRSNWIDDLSTVWRTIEQTHPHLSANPWPRVRPQVTDGETGKPFTRTQEKAVFAAAERAGKGWPLHAKAYHRRTLKSGPGAFAPILAAAKVGEGYTFHSWRHTFRTRLSEAGVADDTAKRLGGWTEDATAALYDHADRIPEIRAALESAK